MKARIKFGLIVGGIGLILNICVCFMIGLCGPVVALLAGVIAGLLAAQQEVLTYKKDGALCGATAGGIAGALMLIGQVIAAIGTSVFYQYSNTPTIFGEVPAPTAGSDEQIFYYAGSLLGSFCYGLVGVTLSAIGGAITGYIATSESPNPTQEYYG